MQTTTDFLSTTQTTRSNGRTLLPLAGNAYRLLGLSGNASQKEIYASASSIKRAIKLGVERTSNPRLAWLGSADLTENGVRDALSRLADPARRISERLFWFFYPFAITPDLSFVSLEASSEKLRGLSNAVAASHDIALLSFAVTLQLDPSLLRADDWRRTFALWKEVIEARDFWSHMMAADLKGDFEQVATFAEIRNLRNGAWRLVTAPVAEIAKDGILHDEHELTRRALDILRLSDLPPTLAHEYVSEILEPVEDKLEILFAEAFSSYRYEVKSAQSLSERRETCYRALDKFNEEVKPALKNFVELAGLESLATRRVFEMAAEGLAELADGFETAFDTNSKLKILRRAWQLAPPDSAALLLIEEHLQAAGELQEREGKTDAEYARQLRIALRESIAQPELFTSYVIKEQETKKFEGWIELAFKIAFFLSLMIFVNRCFSSLPGSRSYNGLGAMNFNIAMPRFTPPMPGIQLTPFVSRVPVRELQMKLKAKTVVLVHVGAKGEYDTGHIPGAISMSEGEVVSRAKRLPKNKQIVLYCYCKEQEASTRAAVELQAQGWLNVAVLDGGYKAWLDAGLPVKAEF